MQTARIEMACPAQNCHSSALALKWLGFRCASQPTPQDVIPTQAGPERAKGTVERRNPLFFCDAAETN